MGYWHHTEVRWTDAVPSEKECVAIADLLRSLDRDTTPDDSDPWGAGLHVSHGGVTGHWRNPMLELRELLAVLHCYGYPCRGRQRYHDWVEEPAAEALRALVEVPWLASEPDLGWVKLEDWERLRAFSRRFARYLPPEPPPPRRKLPHGGQRGRRRRERGR